MSDFSLFLFLEDQRYTKLGEKKEHLRNVDKCQTLLTYTLLSYKNGRC